ncbi:protein odr-4 homolog isoform X2 [Canis lupus baileyi]|uniref:protein odr-4 homolog isoform X2 n=1 Tax=Canis lupus familiaris TaxID=9615 RepID=UPI000DC6AAD2|nr:protein odr-4 homolog isoform X2 [Canis lupus familiaris]XP_048968130.1 protein odr-4 homolog isoform X3 [Canis lupus dingo]
MGRTYIVEETVGQYLSNINLQGKDFVSGLLIGQCSSQKDYVILATRTPPKEEQNENLKHQQKAKLGNLDEEWTTEHANQVSRMLPGGLLVLGVFIITTLEMGNDCQNALRRNGLIRWAKQIENGVYLINGQVKDEDCDLLEGQKKYSRGNVQAASHSFDVKVLTQLILNSDHRSTATVQICSGSVNLKGAVKCRAYVHSNKPKVKDAVQAMKRDILNTVADRCEMLFEDLLLNEIPEKKDSEKEFHILPHRVFVPIPGSTVMLCDYKFGDESAEEMRDHFIEMLDHMIQIEDLEIAEEINTACVSYSMNTEASLDNTDDEQPKQPIKTAVIMKIQQNIGVIAAVVVAVFAAGISFHYFSD